MDKTQQKKVNDRYMVIIVVLIVFSQISKLMAKSINQVAMRKNDKAGL